MLSYEEMKKRLSYDPETGTLVWLEREVTRPQDKTWNKKWAGKETGYTRKNGYKSVNISGREYQSSRIAWLLVHKRWPVGEIDHINGVKIDNRIANLRESTRSENAINKNIQSNNTTGFKGVWKRKNLNSWVAQIQKNGKAIKLGSFRSPEDAYRAYVEAAKELHGEFAKL